MACTNRALLIIGYYLVNSERHGQTRGIKWKQDGETTSTAADIIWRHTSFSASAYVACAEWPSCHRNSLVRMKGCGCLNSHLWHGKHQHHHATQPGISHLLNKLHRIFSSSTTYTFAATLSNQKRLLPIDVHMKIISIKTRKHRQSYRHAVQTHAGSSNTLATRTVFVTFWPLGQCMLIDCYRVYVYQVWCW